MNNKIIGFFVAFFLSFFASLNTHSAPQFTNSDLINITGQQRMLVHQILVSYAQIGQVQSYGNPVMTKQLAIKQFEKNIDILNQNNRFGLLVGNIETSWAEFKKITLAPPKKSEIPKLIKLNDNIVFVSNKIIKVLVNNNKNTAGSNIINISGKQRMLSQRIALYMLLQNWGLEGDYKTKMQLSLANFSINLNLLEKNKDNTPKINKNLKSMHRDYLGLIKIIARGKEERDYSFAISRYTSQLLRKSKKSTKLYVDLKNSQFLIGNTSAKN